VALVLTAFLIPHGRVRAAAGSSAAPSAWSVFAGVIVAGLVFMLADKITSDKLWGIAVAVVLVMQAALILAVLRLSGRPGWGAWHRFGLASGAVLTYTWHAFGQPPVNATSTTIVLISHVIYAVAAVAILAFIARRVARSEAGSDV